MYFSGVLQVSIAFIVVNLLYVRRMRMVADGRGNGIHDSCGAASCILVLISKPSTYWLSEAFTWIAWHNFEHSPSQSMPAKSQWLAFGSTYVEMYTPCGW